VKFGHFCLPTYFADVDGDLGEFMRHFVDMLAESEELGFDSLWANEHHFDAYGGIIPSTLTMLSALAQRTKRVRLGSSIIVLPLHNPIEIAEQLAMIDLMSNGRVDLGVGRGFVAFDYDRFHVPMENSQDRLKDGLALILKAWANEHFSHDGPFYQAKDLQLWPRPQQKPRLPVWLACGGTPESFKWAGEQGFGILTVAYRGVEPLIGLNKVYRQAWRASGHPPNDYRIAAHYQVVLSDNRQEAKALAAQALHRYIGASTHTIDRMRGERNIEEEQKVIRDVHNIDELIAASRILVGTPQEAVEILQRGQELMGFTQVDCTFRFGGLPLEYAERSLDLFAKHVIPRLHD